jgi:hypothetical protein
MGGVQSGECESIESLIEQYLQDIKVIGNGASESGSCDHNDLWNHEKMERLHSVFRPCKVSIGTKFTIELKADLQFATEITKEWEAVRCHIIKLVGDCQREKLIQPIRWMLTDETKQQQEITSLICFDRVNETETMLDLSEWGSRQYKGIRLACMKTLSPCVEGAKREVVVVPLADQVQGISNNKGDCSTAIALLLWCICERFQIFNIAGLARVLANMIEDQLDIQSSLLNWQCRILGAGDNEDLLTVLGLLLPDENKTLCNVLNLDGQLCRNARSESYAYCGKHRTLLLGINDYALGRLACQANK